MTLQRCVPKHWRNINTAEKLIFLGVFSFTLPARNISYQTGTKNQVTKIYHRQSKTQIIVCLFSYNFCLVSSKLCVKLKWISLTKKKKNCSVLRNILRNTFFGKSIQNWLRVVCFCLLLYLLNNIWFLIVFKLEWQSSTNLTF